MRNIIAKANKRVSFGGAASLLIMTAMLSQGLGFLRNRLISANFTRLNPGSSDAFFAAFQIPDFFFYTIAAGALGVAFIPFLSEKFERNERRGAWELTSSLLNALVIVMGLLSVVMFIFAKPLVHAIAPNLPANHLAEAVKIMQIVSLNPLLFSLSGVINSVQQVVGRFFFFAMSPIIYNLSIIASIFVFKDSIGIVGLGVGALVGALLQLLLAVVGLAGLNFEYHRKIHWKSPAFKSVLHKLPARSLDQGVDQINSIVETNRAQTLGVGPVSYYNYALTLMNVPIMLIGNSIATAAFPRLVEKASSGRMDLFRKDFASILRLIIWITMPVLVVCFFCRAYLARLIYGDVARDVALIFGYLTGAIFFRIIYTMLSRWFYAQKDTKTPLYVSLFAIGLNIYLAFTLTRPNSYGISGLALAQSIVAASEVAILLAIMLKRDHQVFGRYFQEGIIKIASVTGFTMTATFIMMSLLPLEKADRGIVTLGSKLGLISLVSLVVHLLFSYLLRIEEARAFLSDLSKAIFKPIKL